MKIPPILEWIHLLAFCLNSASDSIISYEIGEVKDLQSKLIFHLSEPFQEKDKTLVKIIIRAFALENECKAQAITFTEGPSHELHILVLLKYPHGPTQYNDPFRKKLPLPPKENSDHYKKRTII